MNSPIKAAPNTNLRLVHSKTTSSGRHRKRLTWTLVVIASILLLGVILLATQWPFTQGKVIADLDDVLQGKIKFGKFKRTYFPHPGCVAENVTLASYGDLPNPTPITIRKLTIQGSFRGLFNGHVPVMKAEGVHAIAPNASYFSGWRSSKNRSKAIVDRLVIAESILDFSRGTEGKPLRFAISEMTLQNPQGQGPIKFDTVIQNPEPPGEVRITGTLGPWRADQPHETPLIGSYSFRHANLGVFHAIAGTLSSDGNFAGTIQQLEIKGQTDTPDFELTDTGHKIHLASEFQARVNTRNGDVELEQAIVRLGNSGVAAAGRIAGRSGENGKTAAVNIGFRAGKIQDFLFLFLNDRVPPMNGVFSFRGRATLPPGREPFVERIQLQGDFGVGDATLSNPMKQGQLEELSERAEGEKDQPPERTVSDLKGRVVLRRGIATFSNLAFRVPGAAARLHGNYSLINYRINLQGRLFTQATLPQATSGVKSFLLKIISPVLKKNRHGGGVVTLSVTGVYPRPVYKTAPIPHS